MASVPGDANYNTPALARQRIVAIYANRGLPPPSNIDRMVARVVAEGTGYLGTVRGHATNQAAAPRPAPAPAPADPAAPVGEAPATTPGGLPAHWNFNELAAQMFPWLTPELRRVFVDAWTRTGRSDFALDAVRQSPQYDTVFAGNRRPDGSLRMSEAEYFGEKAGFREALSEFQLNPAEYERQFANLFVNEVDARELYRVLENSLNRFVEPGSSDRTLLKSMVAEFMQSGSEVDALGKVRASSQYDSLFQGNRREDGTLRMDEPDYFAYKRGWQRTLAGFALNPDEFEGRGLFLESVVNELSINELNGRLQATQDGILDRIPEYASFYANAYGLQLTPEAILGMAISPALQRDVLERRIAAAQIGGEASIQGFIRQIDRAEQLARAGVTSEQAREVYSEAALRLPALDALTNRYFDPTGAFGIGGFEDATMLGDADTRRRIGRRLQNEQSAFSTRGNVAGTQDGALTGLRQR
jgi:hypothetical protein